MIFVFKFHNSDFELFFPKWSYYGQRFFTVSYFCQTLKKYFEGLKHSFVEKNSLPQKTHSISGRWRENN
jgi:hypothetical protein